MKYRLKFSTAKPATLGLYIFITSMLIIPLGLAAEPADNAKPDVSERVISEPNTSEPEVQLIAPGYGELDFEPPEAGSYHLPILADAHNEKVLNTEGDFVEFHQLFKGKYTLLSFMYSSCNDVNGCPLTYVVFNRIRQMATKDPEINNNLRFISMSFDPENDTPEAIKAISDSLEVHGKHDAHSQQMSGHQMKKKPPIEWLYLTADSQENLEPILQHYNQDVLQQLDEAGKNTGNFSHILRVFLIDPKYKIRNIYSVSFLHPDIIINDVKTLLMAEEMPTEQEITHKAKNQSDDKLVHQTSQLQEMKQNIHLGPGDHKENYHSENYKTRSVSLGARKGVNTNLLQLIENPPLGLPKVPVPANNAITEDKIGLGKKLFFARRLSLNNTISCAMCHIPEQGFTNNELKTPAGFEGRTVRRNAPTIYNTAYLQRFHHDGRETSLENQIWQPLLANNEMAMPSIGMVVNKIADLTDYENLFEQAFNGKKANVVTIGQAIASYERTLISANSAFDRWHFANEENAISESAKRGFNLFKGKALCVACHTVEKDHALFTDNKLHNTGIGWETSMRKTPKTNRVQVAPGQYLTIKQSIIKSVSHGPIGDLGLYEITQNPADRWRYRTPSLRNIALTAPYMHNGSLSTLTDVVSFYNQGGFKNKVQSPLIKPLNLTSNESEDLVDFLKTLTGSNVETLVSDAFAAPIGDVH